MRVKHPFLVLFLVTFLLLAPLPLGPAARHWFSLTNTLENAAHPLVFWWLARSLLPVIRGRFKRPWPAYLSTFFLTLAFGAASEYVQSLVGRDASLEDVRNDAVGVLFALAVQTRRDLRGTRHRHWRPMATMAAVILAATAAFPLAWTSMAYALRWQAYPLIWSPDALFARRFSHWKQDDFPGLVIDEPARDWRGFSALQVKAHSLRKTGTEIRIRVHDQAHNQEFLDRYDHAFVLPDTLERTITIPLETIRHGPTGRELDLSAVRGIIIFQEGARELPRFSVREIRLIR